MEEKKWKRTGRLCGEGGTSLVTKPEVPAGTGGKLCRTEKGKLCYLAGCACER